MRTHALLLAGALLGLAATATAGRALLGSSLDGDDYCPWGGKDYADYPWAHPREEQDWYCKNAGEFNEEALERQESGEGVPLLFYGDSILQCLRWNGDQCEGVADWFAKGWGSQYGALSWALGSEITNTVFWRMLNGNSPKDLNTKVVVIMLGSNNLGQAMQDEAGQMAAAKEVFQHITEMSQWLLDQDDELVVITMGLLPKTGYGDGGATGRISPDTLPALLWYNEALAEYGLGQERVRFVGCWDEFLEEDGVTIKGTYMGKDRLHPNTAGFKLIAKRLQPFLDQYLSAGEGGFSSSASSSSSSSNSGSSDSGSSISSGSADASISSNTDDSSYSRVTYNSDGSSVTETGAYNDNGANGTTSSISISKDDGNGAAADDSSSGGDDSSSSSSDGSSSSPTNYTYSTDDNYSSSSSSSSTLEQRAVSTESINLDSLLSSIQQQG